MIKRNVAIGIGILVLVGLGLMFMSTTIGNVIMGSIVSDKVIEEEYYRISDFGSRLNEVEDGASDNSRPE
ncbi:hypothetical protein HN903_02335 [archaeon]|jgi:hypothetical protein|nr:hypothetical protein [archaeon]MBT6955866.1 hypothetical protein [archaeon]MBT7128571.1 hypothetical protein [archaeon]